MQKFKTDASALATTSDATPVNICGIGGYANNSAGVYRARVMARAQGADECKTWDVTFSWRKNSGGTLTITGALATLLVVGNPLLATAGWTVNAVAVSGNTYLEIKGDANSTIDWAAYADCEYLEQ